MTIHRRDVLKGSAALAAALSLPEGSPHGNPLSGTFQWSSINIGGGGNLIMFDFANDGSMVVSADAYGAYVFNETTSKWEQLRNANRMPDARVQAGNSDKGAYEIRFAPNNSQIIYMVMGSDDLVTGKTVSQFYVSTNKGRTFSLPANTGFPSPVALAPNPSQFQAGNLFWDKMAVDPHDSNTVYLWLPGPANNVDTGGGLWVTHNAGANWAVVSSVPASTDANKPLPWSTFAGQIVFDPNSGVNGSGYTNRIYAYSWGNGLYYSTDGGTTWALMTVSGTPTGYRTSDSTWQGFGCLTIAYAEIGSDTLSALYITDLGASNQLQNSFRYKNGAWTQLGTVPQPADISPIWWICPDPNNTLRLIGINRGNAEMCISADGGTTWTQMYSQYGIDAAHINCTPGNPWLKARHEVSANVARFHPTLPNTVYGCGSQSIWYVNPPVSNDIHDPWAWTSQPTGIEENIANCIVCPPGGKPVLGAWDNGTYWINDPTVPPTSVGPTAFVSTLGSPIPIQHTWTLDWASSMPNVIVACTTNGIEQNSSYSTDGGQNWNLFADQTPSARGGQSNVAAYDNKNFVWYVGGDPSLPGQISYTTNSGASWTLVNAATDTSPAWDVSGFSVYSQQTLPSSRVCCDRVLANTFYFYNKISGTYRSIDGGATWTRRSSFVEDYTIGTGYGGSTMRSVPGHAGHLFLASGNFTQAIDYGRLQYSVDGATTWINTGHGITGVYTAIDVGFGAAAPGNDYPTVFVMGWLNPTTTPTNADFGVYMSTSSAAQWAANTVTWTRLSNQFLDNLGFYGEFRGISGDMNTFGTVYLALNGYGWAIGKYL